MTTSGAYLVYKITNLTNGNIYIGMTRRPLGRRWSQHLCAAKKQSNASRIAKAIRKYGRDNFAIEVIESCDSEEGMKSSEIRLIASLRPIYNIASGGDGSPGHTMSPEARERARQRALGNKLNLGKRWTDAQKRAMSEKKRGCKPPPVTPLMHSSRAENMRRAARERRKRVICLSDGRTYNSAHEASIAYGFHDKTVASVCSGRRKAVYGLSFAYLEATDA